METLATLHQKFSRLNIHAGTVPIFEALLRLSFDQYVPIMELLLDGTIVPEDLLPASATVEEADSLATMNSDMIAIDAALSKWGSELTSEKILARIEELSTNGYISRRSIFTDTSAMSALPDGTLATSSVPGAEVVLSTDTDSITPTSAQIAQYGGVNAAKKALQMLNQSAATKELND